MVNSEKDNGLKPGCFIKIRAGIPNDKNRTKEMLKIENLLIFIELFMWGFIVCKKIRV